MFGNALLVVCLVSPSCASTKNNPWYLILILVKSSFKEFGQSEVQLPTSRLHCAQ